jgi:hypothetical protein
VGRLQHCHGRSSILIIRPTATLAFRTRKSLRQPSPSWSPIIRSWSKTSIRGQPEPACRRDPLNKRRASASTLARKHAQIFPGSNCFSFSLSPTQQALSSRTPHLLLKPIPQRRIKPSIHRRVLIGRDNRRIPRMPVRRHRSRLMCRYLLFGRDEVHRVVRPLRRRRRKRIRVLACTALGLVRGPEAARRSALDESAARLLLNDRVFVRREGGAACCLGRG